MAKKHHKRQHLTTQQVIENCKKQAKSNRMSDGNMWHDLCVISDFICWYHFDFHDDEWHNSVHEGINKYNQLIFEGKETVESLAEKVKEHYGSTYELEFFDMKFVDENFKKGSYSHFMAQRSIESSNYALDMQLQFIVCIAMSFKDMGISEERLNEYESLFATAYNEFICSGEREKHIYALERVMQENGFEYAKPVDYSEGVC